MPPSRNRRAAVPEPSEHPIGALARLADVSTRTVRYYEEIGLLTTARRFAGGRRVFGEDALQRLKFIGRLKRLGFSLEEIRHLNEVFALQRSTGDMLTVLDKQLATHLDAIGIQMDELGRLKKDLLAYRQHIRTRLALLRSQQGVRAQGGAGRRRP